MRLGYLLLEWVLVRLLDVVMLVAFVVFMLGAVPWMVAVVVWRKCKR